MQNQITQELSSVSLKSLLPLTVSFNCKGYKVQISLQALQLP